MAVCCHPCFSRAMAETPTKSDKDLKEKKSKKKLDVSTVEFFTLKMRWFMLIIFEVRKACCCWRSCSCWTSAHWCFELPCRIRYCVRLPAYLPKKSVLNNFPQLQRPCWAHALGFCKASIGTLRNRYLWHCPFRYNTSYLATHFPPLTSEYFSSLRLDPRIWRSRQGDNSRSEKRNKASKVWRS